MQYQTSEQMNEQGQHFVLRGYPLINYSVSNWRLKREVQREGK